MKIIAVMIFLFALSSSACFAQDDRNSADINLTKISENQKISVKKGCIQVTEAGICQRNCNL